MLIRIRVRLSFYPLSPILIYNITTVSHYLLGGAGIILGYHSWMGNVIGTMYILFAFFQMVCTHATFGLPQLRLLQDGQFSLYIRNEPDIEKILTGREPERLSKTRGGVVMS